MNDHEWLYRLILGHEDDKNIKGVKRVGDRIHLQRMLSSGWDLLILTPDDITNIAEDFRSCTY